MDEEQAKQYVTEVTVSASKKKQLGQYEPAEAHTSMVAEVPEDEDPEEVRQALNEVVWRHTEESIMERWEAHVRKNNPEKADA